MSIETNGNNKPLHKAGMYEHKESGAKVYLEPNYELGSAQIDAFVQAGFVWVSDKEESSEVTKEAKNTK